MKGPRPLLPSSHRQKDVRITKVSILVGEVSSSPPQQITTVLSDGDYTCPMNGTLNTNNRSRASSLTVHSGATCHTSYERLFVNYSGVTGSEVELGANAMIKVCGHGDAQLVVIGGGNVCNCLFQNVLCVPDLEHSLTSISTMDLRGAFITFRNGPCAIRKSALHVLTGFLRGFLQVMPK